MYNWDTGWRSYKQSLKPYAELMLERFLVGYLDAASSVSISKSVGSISPKLIVRESFLRQKSALPILEALRIRMGGTLVQEEGKVSLVVECEEAMFDSCQEFLLNNWQYLHISRMKVLIFLIAC